MQKYNVAGKQVLLASSLDRLMLELSRRALIATLNLSCQTASQCYYSPACSVIRLLMRQVAAISRSACPAGANEAMHHCSTVCP